MDDQGEKIVFLARELLNAGATEKPLKDGKLNVTMTFRSLCLTTFLAAAGGSLVTGWAHENDRPLNRYEKTEIQALIFYAAKLKGINEEVLRHEVEEQTGIDPLDDMQASEFPAVRQYLQKRAQ